MLDIGRTNDGLYIVYMTEDERRMLNRLQSAAQGSAFDWATAQNIITITRAVDFTPWMRAVFAWTQAMFHVTDMQCTVDKLREILEKPSEATE